MSIDQSRHLQNKQPVDQSTIKAYEKSLKEVKKTDNHFHIGERFLIKGRVFRLTKIKPNEITMKLIKPGPTNAARREQKEKELQEKKVSVK